jgi:hypothetical protein
MELSWDRIQWRSGLAVAEHGSISSSFPLCFYFPVKAQYLKCLILRTSCPAILLTAESILNRNLTEVANQRNLQKSYMHINK